MNNFAPEVRQTKINSRVITFDPLNQAILLVRNRDADFWYPPGGGLEADEDIKQCAVREMLEETGLHVDLKCLIYAQQLNDVAANLKLLEFFWLAELSHPQELNQNHVDVDPDGNVEEAKWFTKEQSQAPTVYPERLSDSFWDNIEKFHQEEDRFIGIF